MNNELLSEAIVLRRMMIRNPSAIASGNTIVFRIQSCPCYRHIIDLYYLYVKFIFSMITETGIGSIDSKYLLAMASIYD
jgi:hypothetical protein